MSLSLDKAFGILPASVALQARRTELLASNLANADTPDYKSRDFNFRETLAGIEGRGSQLELNRTQANHLTLTGNHSELEPDLLYRTPAQPSLDGNTVDPQLERAAFAENALHFQSSLEFLNRRISGIRAALRKE
ncbi:flagellar basal body rod protein FlgB [Thiorhodococcus mannitoliphagus]|uniref:Flagellar basal body rod protein FlgB n=1 Tax=Thiorhodococcus mannitoliphagus TaxID=329406 RepID=A0A6P1DZC9_9GAMM|nr:flagellar basal body rod protein FlgB [Thiorhodococcus mannitoliphagus]NEX21074.1 flagellar basal body rod protein FlgB [Thiorhodococcus mannitoliphagus]